MPVPRDEPQNIYDDPTFFEGYAELRRTGSNLNDVIEQPAIRRLLPTCEGLDVLDLGCGFGQFAREARRMGAKSVTALDLSVRMLEVARSTTNDAHIEYIQLGIEQLPLSERQFDLAVSSLTLHYVADYPAALAGIAQNLRPGGRLIFSVEHPISTALAAQRWVLDGQGHPRHWPIDCYQDEGPRHTTWFVDGVTKYHRTVSSYVNGLINAGFSLEQIDEPEPTSEAISQRPGLDLQRRRPPFLILSALFEPNLKGEAVRR